MIYRNKKTGAVIETACECGGDWEPVEKKEPKEPKERKPKK